MLGHKEKQFKQLFVSLEQLVPTDNFYRKLEAKLDLNFVYELVENAVKYGNNAVLNDCNIKTLRNLDTAILQHHNIRYFSLLHFHVQRYGELRTALLESRLTLC